MPQGELLKTGWESWQKVPAWQLFSKLPGRTMKRILVSDVKGKVPTNTLKQYKAVWSRAAILLPVGWFWGIKVLEPAAAAAAKAAHACVLRGFAAVAGYGGAVLV